MTTSKNKIPKEGRYKLRSLRRSGRGKILLVGANVIKNQAIQKKTIGRALVKYNVIAEKTPITKKEKVVRGEIVVKKALGK